jgi:hypothetical protein
MFIGHFAVAFGAKSVAPRTSLATLIVAAQLLDLIWPILVLLAGWILIPWIAWFDRHRDATVA